MQHVCEGGEKAVSTKIFVMIELVRESVEMKCKKPALSDRNTVLKAKLVETRPIKGTMRGQLARAERRITAL